MKTKVSSLVNLNTNPCKMCMPMGAVTALYGIKKCMSILHGSQGCSTYIRRHMATHYNEPVDIASSSLTEQGTVYGGEKNLLQGLKNLITLYEPEVIGVATTCLAETIGEDIKRMIEKFYDQNPGYENITIIPINSAGYGGTQFEGYFKALYAIVSQVKMKQEKHNRINVITSGISPADTRYLKRIFQLFELDVILLPDLADNLDGAYKKSYSRLPSGGTSIEDIQQMAGAKYTLFLSNMEPEKSPAGYLYEQYGVPYERIELPVGLRAVDRFYDLLAKISGKPIPEEIKEMRGRYLDGMIDAHKYNGDGRAVIYGEPDFVVSTTRLCVENGVMPVAAATGSVCSQLENLIKEDIDLLAKRYLIERYEIVQDTDFKNIEELAQTCQANLMIGNSDGRRIEEGLNIPLVRRGFPIHDRVGGQRLRMLGYEGSLNFLDEITNAILARKETGFREELYNTYYKEKMEDKMEEVKKDVPKTGAAFTKEEMEEKTKTHPCYNCGAHSHARMHLPVAPRCNIQCNYCVRKFDCPNESRPGVTTKVLTPEEAFEKYKVIKEKVPNLSVVGIAGPGDALANFEETKRTLELIREYDKDVTFCLSTNGLMLPMYAEELVRLGVSHVTVTLNAIDPKIGAKIYKHVNYMGVRFTDESAAAVLLSNQLIGLKLLVERGVICKINIVTLKGINDHHIPAIVEKMKEIGCYITNIMPFIPVEGSVFEHNPVASNKEINKLRIQCGQTMKQMFHCKQCRADAIGTLEDDLSLQFRGCGGKEKTEGTSKALRFAVASKSGMFTDQHFGQVSELYIYEYKEGRPVFLEKRKIDKYCAGSDECGQGEDKISKIIKVIGDCNGVIAMRIGESPKEKLKEKGILVLATYDRIEDAVTMASNKLLS
ncbi:nitrogenase cofactor biosynthesis protein NifB [Anaeromicropila populeti]|uniref:FeMo cofactor biosynthesis protein NifB n=1 Tax=Anaeromicropila populeti TaxID=37658 RepID=A0A1I6HVQ6_9FIRM|nr:nitrogenase cofactor biosynthesis protein NifB [Anaeromicropila populeti]SFR58290.1 nitrogenase cofactor biosynthesis protein NifB [Anaeromicropila populeti]